MKYIVYILVALGVYEGAVLSYEEQCGKQLKAQAIIPVAVFWPIAFGATLSYHEDRKWTCEEE